MCTHSSFFAKTVISLCSLLERRREKERTQQGRKRPVERESYSERRMINDGLRELWLDPEVTSVRELQLASSFRRATDLIINIT